MYKKLLPFIIVALFSPVICLSNDVFVFVVQKQEAKKQTRWSLAEWLRTKERIALMDQWLALNTDTHIFEGYLGGGTGKYDSSTHSANHDLEQGQLGLYIKFFGLEGRYDKGDLDRQVTQGQASLLLIGSSIQSTHLTLFYGMKSYKSTADRYDPTYYGTQATLYLFDFLGTSINLQKYREKGTDAGYNVKGHQVDYSFFFEISFLRLYVEFFNERLDFSDSSNTSWSERRSGNRYGLKIFF